MSSNDDKLIRRNFLIGPWGVGAIVPFPNDESLMIAGLDWWRYHNKDDFVIRDERLEKWLAVKELRWPPDFRKPSEDPHNSNIKIPAVRFPTWHYCPFCGSMKKSTYYSEQPMCDAFQWKTGRKCSLGSKKRRMIPERFVVICPEGHIDDFPVAEWLHYNTGHEYDEYSCRIRRSTGGASSGLSGIVYECTCGAKKSLSGATIPGALEKIDYHCKASKPWLGIKSDDEFPCSADPKDIRVVLSGGTNVWFARTISSLHIPTEQIDVQYEKVADLIISKHKQNDKGYIETAADLNNLDYKILLSLIKNKVSKKEIITGVNENTTEEEYRSSEYSMLINKNENVIADFKSTYLEIGKYDPKIQDFFEGISLVQKLKETRAFVGFSRLEPSNKPISETKNSLRMNNENWLPAIEVFGEGIFFRFNKAKLNKWSNRKGIKERLDKINANFRKSFLGKNIDNNLRPEFVLIHTFAHLIINQLSFECGYGTSSIRERIYCGKFNDSFGMCGVLIYTASGDSDGSLGGLVRQGEPGRIEDTIVSALKNALWCSSDPVCMQSPGQGTDSCNLAACHNCTLLPETCCELGNRFLDRGITVGTFDDQSMGYFSQIHNLELE